MLRLIHRLRCPIPSLSIAWQIGLAAGGASALLGQAPAAPATRDAVILSLDAAVRRAMQKNEDIVIARSQVRGATAQRASARSAFMPQINSQTRYARTMRGPLDDM